MRPKYALSLLFIFGLGLMLVGGKPNGSMAQTERLQTQVDTTTSGIFNDGVTSDDWIVPLEGLEIFTVEVQRISGQFTPRLEVLSPSGQVLAPTTASADSSRHEAIFRGRLPEAGNYTLRVSGHNLRGDVDNPDEYSLNVQQIGAVLPDVAIGFSIPSLTQVPALESGAPQLADNQDRERLGIDFYGSVSNVERPEPGQRPQNFVASGGGREIETLQNGSVLSRLIRSINFVEGGIGVVGQPLEGQTESRGLIFTDRDIVRIENDFTTLTLLLEGGLTISTDFYRLSSIAIVGPIIDIQTTQGQRIILDGQSLPRIDLKQAPRSSDNMIAINYGGRFDPNNIAQNDDYIVTNLSGWQTMMYLPNGGGLELAVFAGENVRIVSDQLRLNLLEILPPVAQQQPAEIESESGENSLEARADEASFLIEAAHQTQFELVIENKNEARSSQIMFDTTGMGDLTLRAGLLSIQPLDPRFLEESYAGLRNVLIENGQIRFQRLDGSYHTSILGGGAIETPSRFDPINRARPNQVGYVPRGFNNLGSDILPSCPCLNQHQENLPVNPVNGNFYYAVQDAYVPSHSLALDFTRHYNSQDSGITPAYMLETFEPYFFGQMGRGWRHSYQIELDITFSPNGEIWLVLPNASRHRFREDANRPTFFFSSTLQQWALQRVGGVIGTWVATRTDGLSYYMDEMGRLQRIKDRNGLSLDFSPVPNNYLSDGMSGGFFVIEPYGRRLEAYTDTDGLLRYINDVEGFQTRYSFTNAALVGVQYPSQIEAGRYSYDPLSALLIAIEDNRGPYHQTLAIEYDLDGRVIRYLHNPQALDADTAEAREFLYAYDLESPISGTGLLRSQEETTVNGSLRLREWIHDADGRILRHLLPNRSPESPPDARQFEIYTYNPEQPNQLSEYRSPQGLRLLFQFNARGQLTRFTDAGRTETSNTDFNYSLLEDGHQLQLNEIRYAGGIGYERFEYDANNNLSRHIRSINETTAVQRLEYSSDYVFDTRGRLISLTTPSPNIEAETGIETRYEYDSFGYVQRVIEGNGLRSINYRHDRAGRLRSITDGRGNQTRINWDAERNLIVEIEAPLGYRISYSYDELGNVTSVTEGIGESATATSFVYNGLNQVIAVTDSMGGVTSYEWDEAGNLLSKLLPDGDTSYTYRYDGLNNLISATNPNGLTTNYDIQFNTEQGRQTRTIIDPLGRRLSYEYDTLGRLRDVRLREAGEQNAANFVYTYTIDAVSLDRSYTVQQAAGRRLSVTYNLLGLATSSSIGASNTAPMTNYEYNPAGWLARVVDPSGRATSYSYDDLGNIISLMLPGATQPYTYSYDENGNLATMTDPLGNQSTYTYDALNRLISIRDPLQNETSYNYDGRGNLLSIVDPRGNAQTASYDELDRITSITDRAGGLSRYIYDTLGRLQSFQDARGFFTTYTYDPQNNVVAVGLPRTSNTIFGYDLLGRVTSVTDALGHTTIYNYNRLERLERISDPLGNETQYRWSGNGRLTSMITPLGYTFEYLPDGLGRLERIRAREDQLQDIDTRFEYDPAGYVLSIRQGASPVLGVDNRDIAHRFTYTPTGEINSYTDPLGHTWRMTYTENNQLLEVVNPRNIRNRYVYNEAGQIIERALAADTDQTSSETFEYDGNGNVIRYLAPDGLVSSFIYDGKNQLIQRTDNPDGPEQRVYSYQYDALGNMIFYEDPAGQQTEYRYDEFGNLVSIERVLVGAEGNNQSVVQRYSYDLVGNIAQVTLPQGILDPNQPDDTALGQDYKINLTYNSLDQRVRYIDAEDNVWAYTYNAAGDLLEFSDPLGSVIRYRYDTQGRVDLIQYPNGAETLVTYDQRGNLNNVQGREDAEDSTARIITYQMDANGNLVAIRDIDNDEIRFTYDAMNNLIRRQDALGRITNYEYDNFGRLSRIVYADGTSITRNYNARHQLTSVQGRNQSYDFEYDLFGHLISHAGPGLRLDYSPDAVGNVLERQIQGLGQPPATRYSYDSLYRLVRLDVGDTFIEIDYNRNDWITNIRRSNGIRTSYSYDTNGRPVSITHTNADNAVLEQLTYTYDTAGNITRINRRDGWIVLFSYDIAHQVIDERWLDNNLQIRYAINIRYDGRGNRTETLITEDTRAGASRTLYVYNRENELTQVIRNYVPPSETSNLFFPFALIMGGGSLWLARRKRVLRMGFLAFSAPLIGLGLLGSAPQQTSNTPYTINYEYDDNGNLLRIIHPANTAIRQDFSYDAENRLIGVSGLRETGEALNVRISYDALGRLSAWEALSDALDYRFYYDGQDLIALEDRSTGEFQYFFGLPDGERLLTLSSAGDEIWNLNDALGSLRRLATPEGDTLYARSASYDFNIFGEIITPYGKDESVAIPKPQSPSSLFTSQLYDPLADLYIMGLRSYAPEVGRFIQRDPIRHDLRANLYTFAYNRPGFFVDPQGTTPIEVLRSTQASDLPQAIKPNARPDSLLSELPTPPAIHGLQYNESMRALEVGNQFRFELNETPFALSPYLADFYIYRLNPLPNHLETFRRQQSGALGATFTPHAGWRSLPNPNPDQNSSPFVMLGEAEPHLMRGLIQALAWCDVSPSQALPLPLIPQPDALTAQHHAEANFLANIHETLLYEGVLPEFDYLLPFSPELLNLAPPSPQASPPTVAINPVIVEVIEALREQQFRFYENTLLINGPGGLNYAE